MSELASFGMAGYGRIGQELARQVMADEAHRWGLATLPLWVIRSAGIMGSDGQTPLGVDDVSELEPPDVMFIAIPTNDTGQPAYDIISHFLTRGSSVITAEKGALANFFPRIKAESRGFRRLGFNASVGGGTRPLGVAQEQFRTGGARELHLVLNGTLTAISDYIDGGMSYENAVQQASLCGFAEPGIVSPHDAVRLEADDIARKTAIFVNAINTGERYLDWNQLRFILSDDQIIRAIRENRRFMVSLYSLQDKDALDVELDGAEVIGGFDISHDGRWRIVGGYRTTGRVPLLRGLEGLSGPGNGLVMRFGHTVFDSVCITGPGAGASPTVRTMIADYLRLTGGRTPAERPGLLSC